MKLIYAPDTYDTNNYIVFLAGSIEMGIAEDWREKAAKRLSTLDITVLNPRRPDWDSMQKQSKNNPYFKEQVNWELDGIEDANCVLFYFDPTTKSPITLMELGYCAGDFENYPHRDFIVCCPIEFWRRGNVEILCGRRNIPLFDNFKDFIKYTHSFIKDNLYYYR